MTADYRPAQPAWVIFGHAINDYEYCVFASNDLTYAELTAHIEDTRMTYSGTIFDNLPLYDRIDLTVGMKTYRIVYGTSYADCMAKLLRDIDNRWWHGQHYVTKIEPVHHELPSTTPALNEGDDCSEE